MENPTTFLEYYNWQHFQQPWSSDAKGVKGFFRLKKTAWQSRHELGFSWGDDSWWFRRRDKKSNTRTTHTHFSDYESKKSHDNDDEDRIKEWRNVSPILEYTSLITCEQQIESTTTKKKWMREDEWTSKRRWRQQRKSFSCSRVCPKTFMRREIFLRRESRITQRNEGKEPSCFSQSHATQRKSVDVRIELQERM